MAEIELSVLERQCLDRRISDIATLAHEAAAWEEARNAVATGVDWRFTTPTHASNSSDYTRQYNVDRALERFYRQVAGTI
jgi:hypothetical protein